MWAGGITLAVAGFFLARYAIDAGILGPEVRVVLGLLFGFALLGGAELAYRFKERVADPRVPQALAGAGLATLYASIYLAGSLYGLIGTGTAFVGLALVTAAALGLSFRFGLPCAVLALVGGFAAPALVGSEEGNITLLAIYLSLVAGGLGHAARRQGRFDEGGGWARGGWLGLAGIVGGLGWGLFMLLVDPTSRGDLVSVGLYLVIVGALLPALVLPELKESRFLRIALGGFAALQMAVLLENSGYEPLSWGLYALLGGALAGLGWKNPGLREAAAIAGGVSAWMMGFWFDPDPWTFGLVGAAMAAIFAGVPLAHVFLGRGKGADVAALAVMPPALILAAYWHFVPGIDEFVLPIALAGLALAVLPALGAWRIGASGWRAGILEASCVATAYAGVTQVLPLDWMAWATAITALGLVFGLPQRNWAARTSLAIVLVWAAYPFAWWLGASGFTLSGSPGLVSDFPGFKDMLQFVAPAAVVAAALGWAHGHMAIVPRWMMRAGAGILGLSVFHVGFKLVFAIRERSDSIPEWRDFVTYGLAERTVWEALLLGVAVLAWQMRDRLPALRRVAAVFAGLSLGHFVIYTGLIFNPLWADQAVGATPVANLLIIAYGIAIAALLMGRVMLPADEEQSRWVRVASDGALMALIGFLALSELRQAFAGSVLTSPPVGQTEDLLRSLLGIVLAIGFLLWGAKSGTRSWRIGSLVLMLAAVCKVFIYDTQGLDQLARIASFTGLGFSLIGIGWFYSKILRSASAEEVTPPAEPPLPPVPGGSSEPS